MAEQRPPVSRRQPCCRRRPRQVRSGGNQGYACQTRREGSAGENHRRQTRRAKTAATKAAAPAKTAASKPAASTASAAKSSAAPKPAAAKTAAPAAAKPAAGKPDNLRRLIGIGPVNEKLLKGQGVTTFAQIAAWTPADIERIEHALQFGGRVERERWVEQAKLLAAGNEAEFAKQFPSAGTSSNT